MKKAALFIALIGIISLQLAAVAQFIPPLEPADAQRDQQQVANMLATMPQMTQVRGGGDSGKPLGMYTITPGVKFNSGYKDIKPQTQAEFAVDLQTFIKSRGGGWAYYQQYYAQNKIPPLAALTKEQREATDAIDRAYVPYKYQADFAKSWWDRHDTKFKETGFMWKDWWISDSVLDANNIALRYDMLRGGGADYVSWGDAVLSQLAQKK